MDSRSIEFFYKNVMESSSDEDSDGETDLFFAAASMVHDQYLLPLCRGSSSKKRKGNTDRDRVGGHEHLFKDYFHPTNPVYSEKTFRRRYRMSRRLFLEILDGMRDYDDYFAAKLDACGKVGFSYKKCSAVIRQLAYGIPGDLVDEYLRMSESTCLEAM
jgi:hypothetical protein